MKRLLNIYNGDILYEVKLDHTRIVSITQYRGDFYIGKEVAFEDLPLDVQGDIIAEIGDC